MRRRRGGSARRRRLLVAACGLVVLVSLVGTGGVSSVYADRDLSVAVVDDDEAYLGIERESATGAPSLTVTNRVPGGESLAVSLTVGQRTLTATLDPGEAHTFALRGVACGTDVTVTAVSESVRIETVRSLDCFRSHGTCELDRGEDGETRGVDDNAREETGENGPTPTERPEDTGLKGQPDGDAATGTPPDDGCGDVPVESKESDADRTSGEGTGHGDGG